MRLKAMAQVRAQTMAARIRPNLFQPGHPRFSRAASAIAAKANGSANIVCEKRTNSPHLRTVENTGSEPDDECCLPPGSDCLLRSAMTVLILSHHPTLPRVDAK